MNPLTRWSLWFSSADREGHELCSLSQSHCKQGCWMSNAVSHVLWLAFLVGRAECCLQQWAGVKLSFPAQAKISSLSLHSHLQSWQGSVVLTVNQCPKFTGWTVILALLCGQSSLPVVFSAQVMRGHLSGILASLSSGVEPGTTFSSGHSSDSAPLPWQEQTRLYSKQSSSLKNIDFTLLSSLVRLHHCFDSTDEQSHWLGLLLGCCR